MVGLTRGDFPISLYKVPLKFQSIPEHVDGAIKTGLNITQKLVKLGEQAIENPEKIMKEKKVKITFCSMLLEDRKTVKV